MKLSIAIADTNALESAFVVFRGFNESIPKAAKMGYNGVELALRRVNELSLGSFEALLAEHNLEVSCITTGQIFADGGLSLTHEDKRTRREVQAIFREFIDLAEYHGKMVNIGRIRGVIGDRDRNYVECMFLDEIAELCSYALNKRVMLLLEPVNRYESDFINTLQEGVDFLSRASITNLGLMPDLFHMAIEERNVAGEIARHIQNINYLHFADSNRLAPGLGHTDFHEIFDRLKIAGYNDWISVEILPKPSPDEAALRAARFLLPLTKQYAGVDL